MIEDNHCDEINGKTQCPVTNQYEADQWVNMDDPEEDQRCEGDVARPNGALIRILSIPLSRS